MKKVLAALLAVTIMLCASACKKEEVDIYAGFSINEELTGGESLQEANAKKLSFSENEEITKIELTFHLGSRMSGGGNEEPASALPEYRIYTLSYPSRLIIEFSALSYTDFEYAQQEYAGLVLGSFVHKMAGEDKLSIFFQLKEDAAVKVVANAGVLEVELKALPRPEIDDGEAQPCIVTANAYNDFCSGDLVADNMTPSLDAGLRNVLLVSGVFPSNIEAELYIGEIVESNISAVREEWSMIPAEYGVIPQYDATLVYKAADSENVLRVKGELTAAEVFIPDGWYLASVPQRSGGGALYSKHVVENGVYESYEWYRLYIRTPEGESKEYIDYDFHSIESAAYSPDGRKLAVLERAEETTNLYIIDIETEEIITNLADVGFGDMISSYTWDDLGTTIYAVSGSDEMKVHQYDFNVPTETKRHSVVEKNGADEGSIAYCGGNVYFALSDMDEGSLIYRVKCDGGVRKQVTYGSSAFKLSDNNAYMAINSDSGTAVTSEDSIKFRLYNMETGESSTITNDFAVQDFVWSKDCTRVYYFENRLSGSESEGAEETSVPAQQDDYPYTLWMYDIATKQNIKIADFPSTAIYPYGSSNRLIFNYSDADTMGEKVKASYIIYPDELLR